MKNCIFQGELISKKYDDALVLDNVCVTLKSGEKLGLLGGNGSGKTTLMSILAGTNSNFSGKILYNQSEITKKNRLKIGYVPQYPILIGNLSVLDNLTLWQNLFNIKSLENANIPDFLEVKSMYKKRADKLSGGMKKRVSLAIALMNNPDFLILDEPFSALDATIIASLTDYLKNNKNMGILFSSHNVYEVAELCDKFLVLKNGRIEYQSKENEVLDVQELQKFMRNSN